MSVLHRGRPVEVEFFGGPSDGSIETVTDPMYRVERRIGGTHTIAVYELRQMTDGRIRYVFRRWTTESRRG
ncbi:hypothetical protein [Haloactinopolyspora sp.]|uniref:hypothetical protein n=1 Tax=Haloactinopolyspora sp. TaxID=1966353 RepID=UPI00260A605A|nr:hypothetical protein [Haloactinopolyspora sp.]